MKISKEQISTIVDGIGEHPAASPYNNHALNVDIASFQKDFNAAIMPFLDKAELDDELRPVMEQLFLIREYQTFDVTGGKFFFNIFGDSVGIFGAADSEDRFKLLLCAYTMPETKNDLTLSSLVLASFVKVLLPEVDAEEFLRNLSGTVIQDEMKFSLSAEGNLVLLTVTEEVSP